jgi:hypothetical protein
MSVAAEREARSIPQLHLRHLQREFTIAPNIGVRLRPAELVCPEHQAQIAARSLYEVEFDRGSISNAPRMPGAAAH